MFNNNCAITGRLTADPELKYTEGGIAHARFTVAVDGRKGSDGEKHTDFIKVHVWRALAERVAQYMRKGRLVGVQGELHIQSYDDRNGVRREGHEIVAYDVRFLDRARDGNETPMDDDGDARESETTPQPAAQPEGAEEPVPF